MSDILLLHGAMGAASQMEELKRLLEQEWKEQVITFDFEGHGSSVSGGFTISSLADQVIDVLDEHQIGKCSVFGYSMGGYVALWLSRYFPGRMDRVITLGTKLDWTPQQAVRESSMLEPVQIQQKVPAFAEELAALHGAAKWKKLAKQTQEMMLDLGDNGLSQIDFELISNPVLLLRGELDKMVSREETRRVAEWIPTAQTIEIPATAHPLGKVSKELLNRYIVDFLNS